MPAEIDGGREALHWLNSIDPPLYLTASPELSNAARLASQYLFSFFNPFAPKSRFTPLLTEGFDAEQIWQQIDLQSQPLISSLRCQVRNFEKYPLEIEKKKKKKKNLDKGSKKQQGNVRKDMENKASEDVEREREDFDADDDDEDEEGDGFEDKDEEEEDEDEDDDDGNMENEGINNVNGVDDRFLKIGELEEYLEEDEAREYGLKKEKKSSKRNRGKSMDADEDDDENEQDEECDGEADEDEGDDEELGLLELDDDEDKMANARQWRQVNDL